ncbi:MAG: DUF2007 domain-containing protein [Kofleriaceae bacterium]|nr:DUF2007 domain-containing protein [Kofleriaceae bacterium]
MSRHADAQVIVATCTNLAEAAAVRSLLGAHDIHVVISGEQHQHAFGGLLGTAVSLDVRVAAGAAERATELIAELRRGGGGEDDDALTAEALALAPPELAPADADADASADLDPTAAAGQLRRRRTVAALVACTITFGTGHAAAGAWLRFMLLAGLEALGLRYLAGGAVGLGASLVVGAVALDIVGSQLELGGQARRARTLPRAQVRKRSPDGRPAPRQ